jgi:hypothetical protein
LKRLTAVVVCAAASLGLLTGTASAKELVVRAQVKLGTYKCERPGTENQFEVEVFPSAYKYHCQAAINFHWHSWHGYIPEELFNDSKCVNNRKVDLYLNGEFYETRKLGEFQGYAALMSPWVNPAGPAPEEGTWPAGQYEVIAPGLAYRAKVFKDNGEDQSEAKSYPAKIVCEKLTLDFGSNH